MSHVVINLNETLMSYKWVLINPSNIQHFTSKNKSQSYIIISWHLELSLYPCCSVLYFCSFITDFQLTHWLLWDLDSILKVLSSILFYWLVCSDLLMIMPSEWLRWMSWDLPEDKSTLVQVMAWCRQASSHYLSQCWPRSVHKTHWKSSYLVGTACAKSCPS